MKPLFVCYIVFTHYGSGRNTEITILQEKGFPSLEIHVFK